MKRMFLTALLSAAILFSTPGYVKEVRAENDADSTVYTAEVIQNNYSIGVNVQGINSDESIKLINDKYNGIGKTDYYIEYPDELTGCKKAVFEFDITVNNGAAFFQLMNSSGSFGEDLIFDSVNKRIYIDLGGKRYRALTVDGNSSSVSDISNISSVDFPTDGALHVVWEVPINESCVCTKENSTVTVTFDDTSVSASFVGRLAENGKSLQYIEAWSRSQVSSDSADTSVESYAEINGFSLNAQGVSNVFTGEHDSYAMAFQATLSTDTERAAKIKWTVNYGNRTEYLTVDYNAENVVGTVTAGIIIDGLNDADAVVTAQWVE